MSDCGQGPDEGAILGWKTDGYHIGAQLHWAMKLEQSQVTVRTGLVISRMDQDLQDLTTLLCLLVLQTVVFTFTEPENVMMVVWVFIVDRAMDEFN